MSTERGYECTCHNPPLQSDLLRLSDQQLRDAYRDREFLIKVLRYFGNVDNDHNLTMAAVWLREHSDCVVGIWVDGNPHRTRLDSSGTPAGSYTLASLSAHDPASGPEPAPDAPGTAGVDAGTGEAGT